MVLGLCFLIEIYLTGQILHRLSGQNMQNPHKENSRFNFWLVNKNQLNEKNMLHSMPDHSLYVWFFSGNLRAGKIKIEGAGAD
jgi:hypothetical protein